MTKPKHKVHDSRPNQNGLSEDKPALNGHCKKERAHSRAENVKKPGKTEGKLNGHLETNGDIKTNGHMGTNKSVKMNGHIKQKTQTMKQKTPGKMKLTNGHSADNVNTKSGVKKKLKLKKKRKRALSASCLPSDTGAGDGPTQKRHSIGGAASNGTSDSNGKPDSDQENQLNGVSSGSTPKSAGQALNRKRKSERTL